MKSQRFRFKVIAILLIGALLFAGTYGLNNIPEASSNASLRNAVRQLTAGFGSNTPSPVSSAEAVSDYASPPPGEPFQQPPEISIPPADSVSSPSLPVSLTPFPAAPDLEETPKSSNFSDALIRLFAPSASPSSQPDSTPTPDNTGL